MEVIVPLKVSLAKTGASPVFVATEWATGQSISRNAVRRRSVGGTMRDYLAKWSHTSSSSNGPPSSWYWSDLGPSAVTGGYTWTTNVQLSSSPTWASGASLEEGATRYDDADQRDYVAAIAMTSGENTTRPSVAVLSSDEIVRSRWIGIGAANAWAPFDFVLNSYLDGHDSSGNILSSVVFSADVETKSLVDRIAFAGLVNVQTVSVKVFLAGSGTPSQIVSGSLIPSGTAYGVTYRSLILPITPVAAGTTMALEVTLTRYAATSPARLGVMVAGQGLYLSGTEWNVETSILPFSSKLRNDTFGTTTFLKRGSARTVKATCFIDPEVVEGDVVQQLLADLDGVPVYWDFNNGTAMYDRLRVFGFYSNMRIAIPAYSFESLSLDVEGLVE